MIWGQVLIPLGAAIVAFFVSIASAGGFDGSDFSFLIVGWAVFSICMFYWRWIVYNINKQIVGLYPIMLRIEKEKKWDIHLRYYFANLSNISREYLRHTLGLEQKPKDFDEFVAEVKHGGKDVYGLFSAIWSKYGAYSVNTGHRIQNSGVVILIVLSLVLVLWTVWGAAALSMLALIVLWELVMWLRKQRILG
jgi:hypothetical protein